MSFLDGVGTGKKLEKGMGVNSGECQRFQIDLEITVIIPKGVLVRTKTWKLRKLVATHPGLGAGDYARRSGRMLRAREAHLEGASGTVAAGSTGCCGGTEPGPLHPQLFSVTQETLLGHISPWEQGGAD